jgi:hypothetical protein
MNAVLSLTNGSLSPSLRGSIYRELAKIEVSGDLQRLPSGKWSGEITSPELAI